MLDPHIEEMVQLWNGDNAFTSDTVNYSLSGKRLDIQLKGVVLPGHEDSWDRVLLSIEDVTAREEARREQYKHKQHAEGLFEHSPVSLWVEDFSRIKQLMNDIRERGIVDFRVFTDVHPEFVRQCMSEIRVLDINRETLDLFLAPDKQTLLKNLPNVFKDDMETNFREQLIDLWNGVYFQRREVVNYALDGTERHLLLQFSVLPGHEDDWSLVQVALADITARKKAEAYLEYLGKHDVLTKLHNRAFYVDELNRLERKGHTPVSIIIIDLNGLKAANDQLGHASGDGLLRRIGEVLNEAVNLPGHAARIGGDEFAVVLPYVDERGADAVMEDIRRLVDINNQYYSQL
jgi:GGDEF domain-containing protein